MKWIAGFFVTVLVLVVGVIGLAVFMLSTLDPNQYKAEIITAAEEQLGRSVALNGEIDVTFYPVLGLSVRDVTIGNPQGFDAPHFAKVDSLVIGAKLIPLFTGSIALDQIILDRPDIHIITLANGRNNLEFSMMTQAAPDNTAEAQTAKTTTSAAETLDFEVSQISITNAALRYEDQQAKQDITINPFNLSLSSFRLGQAANLQTDFKLAMADIPVSLEQSITGQLTADPSAASYRLDGMNTSFTMNNTANGTSLNGSATGSALVNNSDISVEAQTLNIISGPTSINGTMSYDITGSEQKAAFVLKGDTVDLDALALLFVAQQPATGNAQAGSPAPQASSVATASDAPLLPLELLRTLAVNGSFAANSVKAGDLTLGNLESRIKGEGGMIGVEPLRFNFYDGQYDSSLKINATSAAPSWTAKGNLQNLALAKLLSDFAGDDYMSGLTGLNYDLTMRGNTMDALKSSLSGRVATNIADGVIQKWQLSRLLNQAMIFFETGELTQNVSDNFEFTSMDAVFTAANGVITNDNLTVLAPLSHITGNGSVDLVRERLNYAVRIGEGNNREEFDPKKQIPIKITGTFDNPSYQLDLETLIRNQAGEKIEEKKRELLGKAQEKIADELGSELGQGLGNALGGLLGVSPRAGTPSPETAPENTSPAAGQ